MTADITVTTARGTLNVHVSATNPAELAALLADLQGTPAAPSRLATSPPASAQPCLLENATAHGDPA